MSLRTPLARARGLGSAKEGVHHWWMQRLTALALVPLVLWFAASVVGLIGADHAAIVAWLQSPLAVVLLIALIVATFYHAALGMQVIYEDYVGSHGVRILIDVATKFLCFALAVASVYSVIKLSFGG